MSVSPEAKGVEFYVYEAEYRHGIVDSEIGAGFLDFVYDEFEDKAWVRKQTVACVPAQTALALLEAVKLMAAWQGGEAVPSQVVVKVEAVL